MVAKLNTEQHLAQLKRGGQALVSHFRNPQIASKLMAMGVIPGSSIRMVRKAPFGGGCYVKVDNLLIALRNSEALSIVLK